MSKVSFYELHAQGSDSQQGPQTPIFACSRLDHGGGCGAYATVSRARTLFGLPHTSLAVKELTGGLPTADMDALHFFGEVIVHATLASDPDRGFAVPQLFGVGVLPAGPGGFCPSRGTPSSVTAPTARVKYVCFMEALEDTMLEAVRAAASWNGDVPWGALRDPLQQLWRALHVFARAYSFQHRDLKNNNVMRAAGGVYKMVDFGFSRLDLDFGDRVLRVRNGAAFSARAQQEPFSSSRDLAMLCATFLDEPGVPLAPPSAKALRRLLGERDDGTHSVLQAAVYARHKEMASQAASKRSPPRLYATLYNMSGGMWQNAGFVTPGTDVSDPTRALDEMCRVDPGDDGEVDPVTAPLSGRRTEAWQFSAKVRTEGHVQDRERAVQTDRARFEEERRVWHTEAVRAEHARGHKPPHSRSRSRSRSRDRESDHRRYDYAHARARPMLDVRDRDGWSQRKR